MLPRFLYDGRRITDEHTPETLEMEPGKFYFKTVRPITKEYEDDIKEIVSVLNVVTEQKFLPAA